MLSARIQLKIPRRLLEQVDAAARASLLTRSEFIRESVVMRLHDQQLTPRPKLEDMLESLKNADNGG